MEAIDHILKEVVETGTAPGVAAIAVGEGGVIYEGAFGVRGVDQSAPMALDTVFWYASMTKALVAAACMQLVERGLVKLDEPVGALLPGLASPQVLEGFAADGTPRLRPARRPITARHLFTHTAGFGYDIWNPDVLRYMRENGVPELVECRKKSLAQPLVADPGERWEYGICIDWVGQLVEAASGQSLRDYMRDHLLGPLGMIDTDFIIGPSQRLRRASVHQRQPDGSLLAIEHEISQTPEFYMGGGGLYGTPKDYAAFLQMMVDGGRSGAGGSVFKPETIALMAQNSIGPLQVGVLKSVLPLLSNDTDFFPGMRQGWGLSFLINLEQAPAGRSAGSMSWAGLANTYFWIDPVKRVAGLIMTQILPFADPAVLRAYNSFESAVYDGLARAQAA